MSSTLKGFLKITLEAVFKGIIIAAIIIFATKMGWM